MKITCHSCGAKYTVSDEKVQGKTVKMKCRKCGATIVVGGSAQGEASPGAEDATASPTDAAGDVPPAGSFLVSVSDNDQRTMTLAEVVEAYNGGVITAETYVFADGMADWQALAENETIVAALNEAALASAALTGGAGAGYAAATAATAQQPAFPDAGYAPQPAASPAPAMAEAKPTAARRDSGRKSQDLFGGGFGADTGASAMSAGSALAAASSSSPGKREENSVLFSLNALTAAGPAPAPRASATTATKEDSGLIDLKALSANSAPAQSAPIAATPMIDTVGMFPLGAPPPSPVATQSAYAGPVLAEEKKGSKIGLIVGGVVAVAAVIGVFLFMNKGGDTNTTASQQPPATVIVTVTASAPTPPAVTAPTATATETAVAAAPGSAEPSATGPRPKYTGKAPTTGKTTGASTPTSTGPATAKPGGNPCGCKPGDVDCAIKCSMKKK